jgi:hypothetical protein
MTFILNLPLKDIFPRGGGHYMSYITVRLVRLLEMMPAEGAAGEQAVRHKSFIHTRSPCFTYKQEFDIKARLGVLPSSFCSG